LYLTSRSDLLAPWPLLVLLHRSGLPVLPDLEHPSHRPDLVVHRKALVDLLARLDLRALLRLLDPPDQ